MRILDIPQKYSDLADELTVTIMAGDSPSEDLLGRLEDFKSDGPDAINNWIRTIKEVEASMEAIKKEKARLDNRSRSMEQCKEYMRLALSNVLDTAFNGSFRSPLHSASTSNKEEIEVDVPDPEVLPEAYRRVKVEPKLNDLKEAAKNGEVVPGATFTKVVKHRLTIR